MISVQGLHKSYGDRVLFADADLRMGDRDRVAVVGPNGSGKTTLLEMIAGMRSPDSGRIEVPGGTRIGYLPQETDALHGRSVLEEVVGAGRAMTEAGDRLRTVERDLESSSPPGPDRDRLLAEYSRLQERFDALGGYSLEAEAKKVLSGLGFAPGDFDRPTETMSGGWQMRVALAKLLLAGPDVLLLDEPTNHLDLDSVTWLEGFLRTYAGTILLVSHDRDFMNGLATMVVELEIGSLTAYTGDYAYFVEQRELRREQLRAAARTQARKVAHTQAFIDRFRYKNTRARLVQSRVKALEKMERVEVPDEAPKRMKLGFPPAPRSGRVVARLDHVSFSYGDLAVYRDVSVAVERGEKAVLVGPNGAGKTTLLKLFAGALQPQAGERTLGHGVNAGYFAQHTLEQLDPHNRVIQELQRAIPADAAVRPRDVLGRFLFSGDDVDKPVGVLSGGERTRLALAKLLVSPLNFLCLDEPTNHLDIASRDVLEDALGSYTGSIVLITHDRHLIRSVANVVLEVGGGGVYRYPGDYESYQYHLSQQQQAEQAPADRPAAAQPRARGRRDRAADRNRTAQARNRLRRVEAELQDVRVEAERLSSLLADPGFYSVGDGVAEAVESYERARQRIGELEEAWLETAESLEA